MIRFGFRTCLVVALAAIARPILAEPSNKAELIGKCALALAPDVTLVNASDSLKVSWLVLVTEKTLDQARERAKSSGDADLIGVFNASGTSEWGQFQEHRREYMSRHQGTWDEQHAVSVFRQNLPPGAGENFVLCVRLALTKDDGLHAWFSQEGAGDATLHVSYRGTPNTQIRAALQVRGASGLPPTIDIPHDGESASSSPAERSVDPKSGSR